MALTQKMVKEEIERANQLIIDTVNEKIRIENETHRAIQESNSINPSGDELVKELLDEYNGLMATIQYYTGHLNALQWTLDNMKTKKNKEEDK